LRCGAQCSKARSYSVTIGVPKGLVLGPVLFLNIFFNNLDDGTKCVVNKFVDVTKLGEAVKAVKMVKGRVTFQRNLDRLEK